MPPKIGDASPKLNKSSNEPKECGKEFTTERVAILDFGAQYGKLIDRRVRECNVCSDLLPFSTTMNELVHNGYSAVILSGGPNSVYVDNAPVYDPELLGGRLPLLGICYGFQLINKHFGGSVSLQPRREDGRTQIQVSPKSDLFHSLKPDQFVLLTHGDGVTAETSAKNGFQPIAFSGEFVAAIENTERRIYGLQFHPEADLTDQGIQIIDNFLRRICSLKCHYTLRNREQMCEERIRSAVGEKGEVLVLVSGGVDSTVCAALCTKALGAERVHAIHIDNGFMRLNESDRVMNSLHDIGLKVHRFNCVSDFLSGSIVQNGMQTLPLSRVVSPEEKRKIIGDTFMRCKDMALQKLDLNVDNIFLVQGTLRPDLIESASQLASGCADVIKTHHNDSALVRELRDLGRVVEPLQEFHKDEVRELGRSLGLPEHIVNRHPFPGPGLAIRIICADEPFKEEHFDETQQRVKEYVEAFDDKLCAIVLPIKSVGVQGDRRSYSYVAAVFTKDPSLEDIPWLKLEELARLLPNECHFINRVVFGFNLGYNITPINDITVTHINEGTLKQLQQADHIVYQTLCGLDWRDQPNSTLKNTLHRVQQFPVIMIPVHFNRQYKPPQYFPSMRRSVVLRPFITRDFMTGKAALPGRDIPIETIWEMVHRIEGEMPSISAVFVDLTSKPPGTTEWE
ncbi:hypothetical protein niasHS_005834 [Heterodera schachtii]|uniref:GMP synthase (glutamine-hydrolyzing) n=1 Tax=Heterodera schachtii TaxID=97005 RepID=A0ABD2JZL4_HETSC